MGFTSEGLSWVKGLHQKLETSCNEYVDACNKYANTAGEHFKKICDEFCERDKPYDVSDELEKNSSTENPSDCDQMQPTASVSEESCLVLLSRECQNSSHGVDQCGEDYEEILSTGTINISASKEENREGSSDTDILPAYIVTSYKQECIQLLDYQHDRVADTTEVYHDGGEDFTPRTPDVSVHNFKTETEKVKDIMLDDCLDDDVKNEIALISDCAAKNLSFKKRLRNLFNSRKRYNLSYDAIYLKMQNRCTSSSSLIRRGDSYSKELTLDSLESEWELL